MSEFTIRAGSVDVEEIMRHIRTRIREKRGVDYTEDEIRELANVKLEAFLDAKNVRSDLVQHYRRSRSAAAVAPTTVAPPGNYEFEDHTIYASFRGLSGRLITLLRKLLNPVLKLFFNPNPIIRALHIQSQVNEYHARAVATRVELDAMNYQVLNNLVVEMTKLGIEVKNLKMRLESLSSRLDFDERRARALEGIVQNRPRTAERSSTGDEASTPSASVDEAAGSSEVKGNGRHRRRRRRGRRRGSSDRPSASPETPAAGAETTATTDQTEAAAPAPSASDGDAGTPER